MTNKIMQNQFPFFKNYQALRNQLLDILDDDDLAYSPGGDNQTFGELCQQIGEIEQAYIDSFRSFVLDFNDQNISSDRATSVPGLRGSFAQLDTELEETVAQLSDEDISERKIDRGGGFTLSPSIQLHVYQEALLIFYGKASVYLKAMSKKPPQQWQEWIA